MLEVLPSAPNVMVNSKQNRGLGIVIGRPQAGKYYV
jgi:hypothetical protein